jgi:hypothetical protein
MNPTLRTALSGPGRPALADELNVIAIGGTPYFH